jgi:hypothetical protein
MYVSFLQYILDPSAEVFVLFDEYVCIIEKIVPDIFFQENRIELFDLVDRNGGVQTNVTERFLIKRIHIF